MQFLKDLINKENPVVALCKVQSKSQREFYYLITLRKDGRVDHEPLCEATRFGRDCSHILKAKKSWEEEHGWRWNL